MNDASLPNEPCEIPGGARSLRLIRDALEEDLGYPLEGHADRTFGDITTRASIAEDRITGAYFLAKTDLVVCGLPIAGAVFTELDRHAVLTPRFVEGSHAGAGSVLATVQGSLWALLAGERTALNFLQRLSGIATQTARLVARIQHTKATLLDTRKTTPGLRALERYAVRAGGGSNHRFGLFDQVLIKNNHIDALGGDVGEAIRRARDTAPRGTNIEVEVRTLPELRTAIAACPDIVLLDNMTPSELALALHELSQLDSERRPLTEASGGITEANIVSYAESGVDRLSLGALTHSVVSADISLRFGTPE